MTMRSTLLGLVLGFGLLFLGSAAPDVALAQCCTPPPVCCTPPTPPCCVTPPTPPCCTPPPAPPPPTPPCCDSGPRTSVHVNVSSVNVAIANAASSAGAGSGSGSGAGAGSGSVTYYGGGGGGGGYSPPMSTGMIQGLYVDSGRRMKKTSYQATRTKTRRVVIQAFCVDDREIPHPASQVTPDRDIDDAYEGELYRCIAGTYLSWTIAEYNGQIDFGGGQTKVCRKGDALVHLPGGKVECRPQKPGRDCNERSLLRRFGAGVKVLTMIMTETYTAYREEEDRESSATTVTTAMSLDGGVGGIVY